MVYSWFMNEYDRKRHIYPCVRALDISKSNLKCKCRRSAINASVMILWIFFMLNPLLVKKYMNTIHIPKLKTFKKNMDLIQNIFTRTYGDNFTIPTNAIIENINELFVKDEFIVKKILKKDEEKCKVFIQGVLEKKRMDWLSCLVRKLTPMFYPTTWKELATGVNMKPSCDLKQ